MQNDVRERMKIHIDTDIGGDIDDLCALAMLLGWSGVEVVGITTVAEDAGRRAGFARRAVALAGRIDIPIAVGIDVASCQFRELPGYPPDDLYWGEQVPRWTGNPNVALD